MSFHHIRGSPATILVVFFFLKFIYILKNIFLIKSYRREKHYEMEINEECKQLNTAFFHLIYETEEVSLKGKEDLLLSITY